MVAADVLVVCTGNVCRSPYLERRLQAELDDSWGAGQIVVASAGTHALAHAPINQTGARLLRSYGADPGGFEARPLVAPMLDGVGLVITMTREHRSQVTRMSPRLLPRTHALRDLAQLATAIDVSDVPAADDTSARAWLGLVAPLLAARRGLAPPLAPQESGVVDPYGRGEAAYAQMAEQIEACLPAVLRVLRRPSTPGG